MCVVSITSHSDFATRKNAFSTGKCENALAVFKQTLESHAVNLSDHGLVVTMEYVRSAIIKHYHLCRYLLTDEQKVCKYHAQLTVHSSDDVQALAAGMKLDQWKIQEQLKELQHSQNISKKIFEEEQKVLLDKAYANAQSLYQGCVDKLKGSKDTHKHAVSEIIEGESGCVLAEIQKRVAEQEFDLDFHVKKLEILSSHVKTEPKPSTSRVVSGTVPKKK